MSNDPDSTPSEPPPMPEPAEPPPIPPATPDDDPYPDPIKATRDLDGSEFKVGERVLSAGRDTGHVEWRRSHQDDPVSTSGSLELLHVALGRRWQLEALGRPAGFAEEVLTAARIQHHHDARCW